MANRGRPSTKTTTKVNVDKPKVDKPKTDSNVDVEALIAKAVADALKKQEKEFEKQNKTANKRKFISDNTRVRIEQNIDGKFIISDTRGQNFFIELNGYRDSTTMAFKDLKNFHGRNYTFFTSGKLIITDVTSENDITVEDVINDLNLQKVYYDENKISPIDIEDLFTSKYSTDNFEKAVRNSVEIAETILEIGYVFYRRGQFTDNSKMNILRTLFRNPNLFI